MWNSVCWLLHIIYLHSLIHVAFTLFLLLSLFKVFATATLTFKVFTAVVRSLSFCSTGVGTSHLLVFNHRIRVDFAGPLWFLFILLVGFLSTVLFAVGNKISFRLLRWELRRSRFF